MSRTVRRKNKDSKVYLTDFVFREDGSFYNAPFSKKEDTRRKVWLFGDGHSGVWNAPRPVRKECNRNHRNRNKRELLKALQYDDFDSLSLTPCPNDADWNYF